MATRALVLVIGWETEPTDEIWKSIALDFDKIWQFPHCVGVIDRKPIVMKETAVIGPFYCNYEQTFSVVLMADIDTANSLTIIDVVGWIWWLKLFLY